MDERNQKRDLVLAPSEYAYMQDVTKGVIKTYTGPTVINPTAQERPVVFNPDNKRFEPCTLEQAVQQIAIAPEGYYVVLKNPSAKNDHPPPGGVFPSPDLEVGRKINITGPCSFPLWPGQMVKLVPGHHLRSNQYLVVRVYNEDEARRHWGQAVVKPAGDGGDAAQPIVRAPAELTVGKLFIIKGTDVSFYIPPTGVGVVPDEHGSYVRDALTLERLETLGVPTVVNGSDHFPSFYSRSSGLPALQVLGESKAAPLRRKGVRRSTRGQASGGTTSIVAHSIHGSAQFF